MPLSSVLGAQSRVRPGVCTSSTRPASPFEGQLIFETDTNRVVAYDGSAWVYAVDTDQPPGLQLVKTQTIGTAVSSVTVTDAFSADFENYHLSITGGSASTVNQIRLTLGSTASNYYYLAQGGSYPGSISNATGSNTTFYLVGNGAANGLSAVSFIGLPNVAARTSFSGQFSAMDTSGSSYVVSGFLNDSNQYTAFTLTTSTGTLTGGTIRVYGYRNS